MLLALLLILLRMIAPMPTQIVTSTAVMMTYSTAEAPRSLCRARSSRPSRKIFRNVTSTMTKRAFPVYHDDDPRTHPQSRPEDSCYSRVRQKEEKTDTEQELCDQHGL